MHDNPFEPPRAAVAGSCGRIQRPAVVAVLALAVMLCMLAAIVFAVLLRPMAEAAITIFFSAFLWFVPVGLLRGRPWAPAAAVAAGLFVALFVFGSLLFGWREHDALALGLRLGIGLFALVLAATMLALRRHRFFAVLVPSSETAH